MALTSYPFEGTPTTETQYTLLFRQFADTGVVGNIDGPGFAVSSDGTGLDLQVAEGFAVLRGHAVDNDAPVTVNLPAADPSNARIDLIVLRLDPVANAITLEQKNGTPAATPSAPVLEQTATGVYEIALAEVRVPAGALNILQSNITDRRHYSGDTVGVWHTATRPTDMAVGKFGYNADTGFLEVWTGSQWRTAGGEKNRTVVPHTFTLVGPIQTPNGSDYFIPPFFVPASGQTAKIVGMKSRVWHGATSSDFVTWIVRRYLTNGTTDEAITSKTTSVGGGTRTDTAGVTVNDGEALALAITGISGAPKNMTVTLYLQYES